jgi:ABC-type transport system involved in multi-copper enzyme maturation permease subunit
MKMTSIIKNELLYSFKKIYTPLFFVLLMFQGLWYMIGVNDLFDNNNILLNAPAIAYLNLSVMGIILFAITSIISAGALARDLESGAANIIYPAIIHEKKYFLGKYIGVVLVNFAVVLGYPIGIILFSFIGLGSPDQFGPVPFGQMLHGFILFTIPNLIFLVTFAVFLVVMFRKAAAAYLGTLLVCILFLLSVSVHEDTVYGLVVELLDPFGYCSVESITQKMDVLELNSAYLPVSFTLLLNRIGWLTISFILFVAALLKFNCKTFIAHFVPKKRQDKRAAKSSMSATSSPPLTLTYGIVWDLVRTMKFSFRNLKDIIGSPIFLAVAATLFLMFLGYNFFWTSAYYLTTSHLPLTSIMTYVRIPMMVVISIILIILSGELLFKDRTSGVWKIVDAMPTPSWVLVLSRFLTMGGVAFLLISLIFVAGVLSQLAMGFTDIEWGLYVSELYGSRFGWLTCLHIISLAFFCGALFNSRLKGHIVSTALFTFIAMSVDYRLIEQLRFAFLFVPATFGPEKYNYSEMNGYGVLDTGLFWYAGAWTALAVLLCALALFLWNRGVDRTARERLRVIRRALLTPDGQSVLVFMACCLLVFGFFQYGIHDHLICKAGYQTQAQEDAEVAAYEKKYACYREVPQPKIVDMDLALNLFPKTREANYTARLVLENKTAQIIDTLHLDWDAKLTLEKLASNDHTLENLKDDEKLRHAIYRLQPALAPGKRMHLNIQAGLAYKGFHQSKYQGDLTYNGTVLGTDLLPCFGYDRSRELDNNKKRLRQGLALLQSRMDTADNTFSRANRFESSQSDGLTWNMVISTDEGQRIVAPGVKVRAWSENERWYARFHSRRPGGMDFKIISANFAEEEFDCQGKSCRIIHDPRHLYNLAVFQSAMEKGFLWLSEKLGPYPYSQIQVAEKPFYDADFVTFSNVTAISENRGWTADIQKKEDGQYLYLIVAEQLARQWLLASLKVADVQGAQFLTESIARYYAFRFMDEACGTEQIGQWLDQAYKDYEKGRGEEGIEEKILLRVDKASYLSRNKGGLALYALSQRVGAKAFDQWLTDWIAVAGQQKEFLTTADFYGKLKSYLPEDLHSFAQDWLEDRIQYRLSLTDAQALDHRITLSIQSVKQRLGGKLGARVMDFSAPLEVGLIDESGNLRDIKTITLKPDEHTYIVDCPFVPAAVLLDPSHWYLVENRQSCFRKL